MKGTYDGTSEEKAADNGADSVACVDKANGVAVLVLFETPFISPQSDVTSEGLGAGLDVQDRGRTKSTSCQRLAEPKRDVSVRLHLLIA